MDQWASARQQLQKENGSGRHNLPRRRLPFLIEIIQLIQLDTMLLFSRIYQLSDVFMEVDSLVRHVLMLSTNKAFDLTRISSVEDMLHFGASAVFYLK